MSFSRGVWAGWGTPTRSSPTVPNVPDVQVTLPTSAYGQTLPVVYGKCRLPAAYIWVPPILTVTSTHVEYWDTITSTTAKMSCRLRFARPLVPNSTWTMRKLYANGKAIYDASIGYRKKGLKFTAYDGRSTQPRDPTMVAEEGLTNVSAHRGYLDIVVKDFDIVGLGAPPVFEAEWIQDGATTHDYDLFRVLAAGTVNLLAPDWEAGTLYGRQNGGALIRHFSIGAQQEYFATDNSFGLNYFSDFRYSRTLDKLVFLAGFIGSGDSVAVLVNPLTGAVDATSASAATTAIVHDCAALVDVAGGTVLVGFSSNEQIFSFYADSATGLIERSYQSTASFGGYANIECVTPGEVRGSEFDVYFCADADLVKVTLTALGTFKSSTVIATLADDLRYAVYDDGDLVVWTDAATVKRINGTTGAVEFTKTVPYQIETVDTRDLGSPDQQRLVNELYFAGGGTSYFTNLDTGLTRSIAGTTPANPYVFDGQTETIITTNGFGVPERLRIIADDGGKRLLTDFLQALMEAGGFAPDEIAFEGSIDDLIDGAVIDITASVRDIARSVCEPYSIAMFER
ncbi:hypothetical protein [Mesorhizobium sp. M0139]|uniref:hypothetical protein n=1 Tax=Mesorhizobium sp. M0139 TaxID=2956892 RepID=UPI003335387C